MSETAVEILLPADAVHGLFVDWRHHEADGRHCCLAAGVIENPPFEGLGVVEERTLIAFMDSDLGETKQQKYNLSKWESYDLRPHRRGRRMCLTSCCLKSQTA